MKKYEELSKSTKKIFLEWVREGLLRYTRDQVVHHTHYHYQQALRKAEDFSPETIWKRLNNFAVDHIEHVQLFVDQIETELQNIDAKPVREISSDVLDESDDIPFGLPDETKLKPMKKTKKLKKGN